MSQDLSGSVCIHYESCASSSLEPRRVNCLFCQVFAESCFNDRWFPGAWHWWDEDRWQPTVKENVWWGWKGLFRLKSSFASTLKAYQMWAEIWHGHLVSHLAVACKDTRSVTQRPSLDSAALNSNMLISAGLKACTQNPSWKLAAWIHLPNRDTVTNNRQIIVLLSSICRV